MTHCVGLTPCGMCKAVAAPSRDLNETNAAGTSCSIQNIHVLSSCKNLLLVVEVII